MENIRESESVSYDPRTGTYHAQHEWSDPEPLSDTVLRTVAVATNGDLTTFDPLYEAIDVDALDHIYKPRPGTDVREAGGCLTFTYCDCTVTIYWDGRVVVAPDEDDA